MLILIKVLKSFLALTLTVTLWGCESARFYYQAIEGQLDIISKKEPIDDVINNPHTDKATKEKLKLVLALREFASKELKLDTNGSYSEYADLQRPYVVWNLFAAPEFSIKPKTWCYPIAGCVAYKGFFNEEAAKTEAQKLSDEGLDVYVGGVAAYSTLGWFDDPVLNTFLFRSDLGLAALLFHELAHQKLYVQDDSAFNESFATTVEILGLEQWLKQQGRPQDIEIAHSMRARKEQFVNLVLEHRNQLETLYASDINEESKREQKQRLQSQLRERYQALKESWGGYAAYDHWFEGPLNNAQLATIATYHHWVDSFRSLFKQAEGNWEQFYSLANKIAQQKRDLRDQSLEKLSDKGANYRL